MIFEKCLKEKVIHFLAKNNILSKNQFGIIENMSTIDAMYELIREVADNMNRGRKTIAVLLDLAKAFDSLSFGSIRNSILNVFKSNLIGRI